MPLEIFGSDKFFVIFFLKVITEEYLNLMLKKNSDFH